MLLGMGSAIRNVFWKSNVRCGGNEMRKAKVGEIMR
jgi:hypothetical protein